MICKFVTAINKRVVLFILLELYEKPMKTFVLNNLHDLKKKILFSRNSLISEAIRGQMRILRTSRLVPLESHLIVHDKISKI